MNRKLGAKQIELINELKREGMYIQEYKCFSPLSKTQYDLCDEGNTYKAITNQMFLSLLNRGIIHKSSQMTSLEVEVYNYTLTPPTK